MSGTPIEESISKGSQSSTLSKAVEKRDKLCLENCPVGLDIKRSLVIL